MNAYNNPTISVYLHLETDHEFVARLKTVVPRLSATVRDYAGDDLDEYAWRNFRLQRKLVWVTP